MSECERTWLFLRMPCGADDCPSEKLDRRNRPRPQLPPPLAPCSPMEETESSFWELLEEKRLELLLLLLLVLALLQARPRRPKLPMARYSGPSLGSLCASSWLPVQVSSLWLVVLELISLAGEKGSLGEGMRELGCSREVLSSLKEEERVAGQCSWGWLVLEQTEELAGLLSEGRQEGGITHTPPGTKTPPYGTWLQTGMPTHHGQGQGISTPTQAEFSSHKEPNTKHKEGKPLSQPQLHCSSAWTRVLASEMIQPEACALQTDTE